MHCTVFLKIPLLILGATCSHIACTNPNPSPKVEESQKYNGGDWLTRFHEIVVKVIKTLAILAAYQPSSISKHILDILTTSGGHSATQIRFTLAFYTGILLQLFGGITRKICYRALGQHFTFSLTVQEDHQLVTTGPYSIVRHPAYIVAIAGSIGMLMVQLGSGSWWSECGASETSIGRLLAVVWVASMITIMAGAVSRVDQEDRVLRREFGIQWDTWSKNTPYRLIPGIY
ncbi:hypothetical protein WOLCODRAFT_92412 [Wolfiporia cocos MD-104 SS10]|uniref:Protein-S-isoprenylcysteine O-methyltransferase n=1 Tax=Wolfiporia cocos (strain MD-104) TaxID=742152 RepID=A0A2H3J5P6_WOLCO|nr:hypothetical protein WOLCODRAFT_92412 [Wolfiporia cocos MD-104 SS10]